MQVMVTFMANIVVEVPDGTDLDTVDFYELVDDELKQGKLNEIKSIYETEPL